MALPFFEIGMKTELFQSCGAQAAAMTLRVQLRGAIPCLRSGAEVRKTPSQRSGDREELPHAPRPRSRAAAKRSYPASEVRVSSLEELPHIQGQGWQLNLGRSSQEELPPLEARGGGQEERLHIQGVVATWAPRAYRNYSTFKVRRSGSEEIPLKSNKHLNIPFQSTQPRRGKNKSELQA